MTKPVYVLCVNSVLGQCIEWFAVLLSELQRHMFKRYVVEAFIDWGVYERNNATTTTAWVKKS